MLNYYELATFIDNNQFKLKINNMSELEKQSQTKEWRDLHFTLWAFFDNHYLISIDQMKRIKNIIEEDGIELQKKEYPHL